MKRSTVVSRFKQTLVRSLPRALVLGAGRHNRGRRAIASRYLRGSGIEIGALGQPLLVPRGARVEYVDRMTKAEALERFPDLPANHLVSPIHVGDGFELGFIERTSQDFVVANHVLEHSPDPLGVLENWARVLKPGGVLFVTVPHLDYSFDRGREVTGLEHMIEDHRLAGAGRIQEFWERSRAHYREWAAVSEVNASGGGQGNRAPAEIARRADRLLGDREEIHFHTFTETSYRALLEHFAGTATPRMRVAEVTQNRTEIVGVLQRS